MAIWAPYPYRILLGYGYYLGTVACVPQVYPIFSTKKIFRYGLCTGSGTGWVQAGLKAAKTTSFFRQKLFDCHSLSRSIYFSLYHPHSAATLSHHHFVSNEAAREWKIKGEAKRSRFKRTREGTVWKKKDIKKNNRKDLENCSRHFYFIFISNNAIYWWEPLCVHKEWTQERWKITMESSEM